MTKSTEYAARAQRVLTEPPTSTVTRHSTQVDGLRLATVVVQPEVLIQPVPLVVTLGIMAHLEAFEIQRFRLLADLLARPVVAIDTPGWTMRDGKLSTQIRGGLRTGGFEWIGRLLADALERSTPTVVAGPVSVLGYSMGASTGSALAAEFVHRGAPLRGVTLVEPVAVRRQALLDLAWRNFSDARHGPRYVAQSASVPWAVAPRRRPPVPRGVDLGHLVWALSRGQIPESLAAVPATVPVMIISGERSVLAPPPRMRQMATQLRRRGHQVSHHWVPRAHHALWNSLPHVADAAEAIL